MSAYGSQPPHPPSKNGYYYSQQPAPSYYYQQQETKPQQYGQQPPKNGDYYSQQPAPSYYYQQEETKPQQYGQSNIVDQNKINQNPKYNDLWATILFLLCLISFAVLGYFGINEIKDFLTVKRNENVEAFLEVVGISFAIAIGSGFLITLAYFFMMQRFAGKMIWTTGVLMILLNLALGIFALSQKVWPAGIIMLIFTFLWAWIFYSWRHRIPFAKVLLKTATRVTGQFPATMFSGFIGLCVELGLSALFILSVAGWLLKNYNQNNEQSTSSQNNGQLNSSQNNGQASGGDYAVVVYLVFCFYWSSQVVQNVVHVTVSGLFATVYFMGTADQTRQFKVTVPVQNPTAKSAKRALTTSFGSICYGSLIIALIQTVRYMVRTAERQAREEGSPFAFFCLYCLDCILSVIESLVEYFNKYAFTQVAIYGKDFCTAGKDTWRLVKSRGVDAIINDSLIGSVLGFGAFFAGLFAGGFALLAAWQLGSKIDLQTEIDIRATTMALSGTLGFIIGIAEFNIMAEVITSGVTTIFVCLAEDPYALQRTQPELFQKIAEVYPQVMNPA